MIDFILFKTLPLCHVRNIATIVRIIIYFSFRQAVSAGILSVLWNIYMYVTWFNIYCVYVYVMFWNRWWWWWWWCHCFLAQDVLYTSRAYATMSVSVCLSVCLSVTEAHWRIIANLGFKFRPTFTEHCGHCACQEEGRDHRREEWRDHLALC